MICLSLTLLPSGYELDNMNQKSHQVWWLFWWRVPLRRSVPNSFKGKLGTLKLLVRMIILEMKKVEECWCYLNSDLSLPADYPSAQTRKQTLNHRLKFLGIATVDWCASRWLTIYLRLNPSYWTHCESWEDGFRQRMGVDTNTSAPSRPRHQAGKSSVLSAA